MAHRHLLVSSPLALLAAFFVTSPAFALTPECEEDADCGTGFVCEVTYGSANGGTGGTAGTGSGSGGGAGASAFCGDGWCHFTETAESCAADCVEVTYCTPAPCDDTADCAAGYFCQAGTPPGTGGTGPEWCGDGICSSAENVENCADDCAVSGVCAIEWSGCSSNLDCPAGFYCDLPSSGSGSGGISGAGGDTGAGGFTGGSAGTVGSGGAGGAEGGTGGSTGGMAAGGTSAGGQAGESGAEFAAPRPEGGSGGLSDPLPGVCLPTGGGSGGAPGTGGVASGGVGAVSAGGSAGADTGGTGAVDGGTGPGGSAGTTATGTGATGSGATGGTSSNAGGTSGTGSESGGMAGDTDGPKGDHGGGCSYSASSSASPFGLLAGLAFLFARSRRRNARR
jgi:MYXO-CTERM domain-containing protein